MSNYDYERDPQGARSFFDLKKDKRVKRFLEAIKDLSCPNILEVGMGQGQFLRKISMFRPDVQLYGIDISNISIEAAKNDNSFRGTFVTGDAQELPFANDFFDVVVMMDVLEHVKSPQKAIMEAKRVLKPGGIFHFYVPCEGQPLTLECFLRRTNFLKLGNFTRINFGHINYFSQNDIINLVYPHFSNINISYSAHWLSQMFHLLTLYLPKKIISLLGTDIQRELRDAHKPESGRVMVNCLSGILKYFWSALIFPVSIIYEIETFFFHNKSFGALGLHFTGKKHGI